MHTVNIYCMSLYWSNEIGNYPLCTRITKNALKSYYTIFIEYRLLVQEDNLNIHYMYFIKIKCSSQHAYWANVDLPFSSSVCVKMTDFDE